MPETPHEFAPNSPEYQAMLDAASKQTVVTFATDEEAGIVLAERLERQALPSREQAAVEYFLARRKTP